MLIQMPLFKQFILTVLHAQKMSLTHTNWLENLYNNPFFLKISASPVTCVHTGTSCPFQYSCDIDIRSSGH